MPARSVCPACHESGPSEFGVCPHCGASANLEVSAGTAMLPELSEEFRLKVEAEWKLASTAFPKIRLDFESFLLKIRRVLMKQMPESAADPHATAIDQSIRQFLDSLKWPELFLTTACVAGDGAAWELFHSQYESTIRKTAFRALGNQRDAEDLANTLMTDLFLPAHGTSKADSKIAQYHGMGSLEGWIKVVIHRLAIDRFRVQNKNVALEDLQAEPASTVKSRQADAAVQSLETQKALKMVSGSLTKALAKLTHKDKLVLKLYYLRNVSLKEIGRLLEVHESTASRLLDRLKTQLLKSVAKNLHDEFKVKKNEVAHVIELAQDHLELDLKEILAD